MENELKPCERCGELPAIENDGTCIEFYCCISLSAQKCDIIEEKTGSAHTFDFCMKTFKYLGDGEKIVMDEMVRRWNTRQPHPAIKAVYEKYVTNKASRHKEIDCISGDGGDFAVLARHYDYLISTAHELVRAIKKAVEQ